MNRFMGAKISCLLVLLLAFQNAEVQLKDLNRPEDFLMTHLKTVKAGTSLDVVVYTWQTRGSTVAIQLLSPRSNVLDEVFLRPEGDDLHGLWTSVKLKVPSSEYGTGFKVLARTQNNQHHETSLVVKRPQWALLVQTDKPVYKPGDVVKFRVVGLDDNMMPVPDGILHNISIVDGGGSRLMQWVDIQLRSGMRSFSFQLTNRPVLGTWNIKVKSAQTASTSKSFLVEKYVLPKFEVQLTTPKKLLTGDPLVNVEVCARYTYSKDVRGTSTLKACLMSDRESVPVACTTSEKQASGCHTHALIMSELKHHRYRSSYYVQVNCTFQEDGTKIQVNTSSTKIRLTEVDAEISFVDPPAVYRKNLPLAMKFIVKQLDGQSATGKAVAVDFRHGHQVASSIMVTIDNRGQGSFAVPTDTTETIQIVAVLRNRGQSRVGNVREIRASHQLMNLHSPSNCYISLEVPSSPLKVGTIFDLKMMFNSNLSPTPIHLLMACRGTVRHLVTVQAYPGLTQVPIPIGKFSSPMCRLTAMFVNRNREVVADSIVLPIEESLDNQATMSFSESIAEPGSQVMLELNSASGCTFGIVGIDKSVELMRRSADIGPADVHSLLATTDVTDAPGLHSCLFGTRGNNKDSRFMFSKAGLVYRTTLKVDTVMCAPRRPWGQPRSKYVPLLNPGLRVNQVSSNVRYSVKMEKSSSYMVEDSPKLDTVEPSSRVRSDFPETWLWMDYFKVGEGVTRIRTLVPDTITTWVLNAVVLSAKDGIGFVNTATLRVFQPFFLSMTLPYSIVLGEKLKVPMVIFNYLDECLPVKITHLKSDQYQVVESGPLEFSIGSQMSALHSFFVQATVLGTVSVKVIVTTTSEYRGGCQSWERVNSNSTVFRDEVYQKLIVEPQGVPQVNLTNNYICLDNNVTDNVVLTLPNNAVLGSEHAEYSVVGDVMGQAMEGIGSLLKMPYGCGEQNMINFAPNVYILQYLQATGQFNLDIKAKAMEYMKSGYQRQLSYKYPDGSYSAFGPRNDDVGSTWLTAFVLKSFYQAKEYVFIDEKDITDSIRFLRGKQLPDGCFIENGIVHQKSLMGGMNGGGSLLTAFVLIALLESGVPVKDDSVSLALACLKNSTSSITTEYGLAVLSYALVLAEPGAASTSSAIQRMLARSTRTGSDLYWGAYRSGTTGTQASSSDIETTGYALMTILKDRTVKQALVEGPPVVRWLTRQRNSYGGYASTQDTCVALQALSRFAVMVSQDRTDVHISVRRAGDQMVLGSFTVETTNRLLLQKLVLPPGSVALQVSYSGKGCVLAQTSLEYNMADVAASKAFSLEATVKDSSKSDSPCRPVINICARYLLPEDTGMVLVKVDLWTGFEVDFDTTVAQISSAVPLKMSDFTENAFVMYFDKWTTSRTCISVLLVRTFTAEDVAARPIEIYNYYDTSKRSSVLLEYKAATCPGG